MIDSTFRAEQLHLLEPTAVASSLRLDARTRRVGLAGVAQARSILVEQARRRALWEAEQECERRHPPTHPAAA